MTANQSPIHDRPTANPCWNEREDCKRTLSSGSVRCIFVSTCSADGPMMMHVQGHAYQRPLEFCTRCWLVFRFPSLGVPREQLAGSISWSGPFSCPPEKGWGERSRLRAIWEWRSRGIRWKGVEDGNGAGACVEGWPSMGWGKLKHPHEEWLKGKGTSYLGRMWAVGLW